MKLDAYVKVVLTIIAVALVALAFNSWLQQISLSRAEAQEPRFSVTIPKAWGKIIGFSNNNLLMEASDGTLRSVDLEAKSEATRVKVQVKMQ
jgi:uncharacterized membrane protein YidH (DUF202 family)